MQKTAKTKKLLFFHDGQLSSVGKVKQIIAALVTIEAIELNVKINPQLLIFFAPDGIGLRTIYISLNLSTCISTITAKNVNIPDKGKATANKVIYPNNIESSRYSPRVPSTSFVI